MSDKNPVVEIADDEDESDEYPNLFVTPDDIENGNFKTLDDVEEELEKY